MSDFRPSGNPSWDVTPSRPPVAPQIARDLTNLVHEAHKGGRKDLGWSPTAWKMGEK